MGKHTKKRKTRISNSDVGDNRCHNTEMLRSDSSIEKRAKISDAYCWICHKHGDESLCDYCPRAYHSSCLEKFNTHSICECQMKTIDGEEMSLSSHELKRLLQYVFSEAIKENKKSNTSQADERNMFCRLFRTWPIENETPVKVMDLEILIDNMNGEEPYLSTGQLYSDVKWIYHNCYILHGANSQITKVALKLENNFKQELTDLEACSECYKNKFSNNGFFTDVCTNPHPIVWAKLRGFPFWPAKCLKIHNGFADVRFFGTHDMGKAYLNKCFKISLDNPEKKAFNRTKYKDAIDELSTYVCNYENEIGPFQYYKHWTPFTGDFENKESSHKAKPLTTVTSSEADTNSVNLLDENPSPAIAVSDFELSNFVHEDNSLSNNGDDQDEDIEILHEQSNNEIGKKTQDLFKNPFALKAAFEILVSSRPHLKEQLHAFQSSTMYHLVDIWIDQLRSNLDGFELKTFIDVCKKFVKKIDVLKKYKVGAEKKIRELNEKIESMKELPSQKRALKDSIIQAASQKILNLNEDKLAEIYCSAKLKELENSVEAYKVSEAHLVEENTSLRTELESVKMKFEECCENLKRWEASFKNVCSRAAQTERFVMCNQTVQTEESHLNSFRFQQPDQTHLDSSQSGRNIQDNAFAVENDAMSSVPGPSFMSTTTVVQQVHEQTLCMRERQVITHSTDEFTNVAAHHSLILPNSVISSEGPIILSVMDSHGFVVHY